MAKDDRDELEKLRAVAKAAVALFEGDYSELCGQIVIPLTAAQRGRLRDLEDRLYEAGYEWITLT